MSQLLVCCSDDVLEGRGYTQPTQTVFIWLVQEWLGRRVVLVKGGESVNHFKVFDDKYGPSGGHAASLFSLESKITDR